MDNALMPDIERILKANMQVYDANKVWKQIERERVKIAHCIVNRLINRLGLQGVRRGKVVRVHPR